MIKNTLFMIFLYFNYFFSQGIENEQQFSTYNFGILGGISFSTIPTAGGAIQFEIKTNVTSSLYLKSSIAYTLIYDDDSYEVKSYRFVTFDDYAKYHTLLFTVDKVEYSIIPLTVGAEYIFLNDTFSPFAVFDIGYNFSTSKAQGLVQEGIAGIYDTIDEIPDDYRKIAPALDDGSSITIGLGLGIRYKLSMHIALELRYLYRYNEAIINSNQILFGIMF
ncbi:MAG: outer membrane beta-barrel protein [Ignavibacteriaceae bacterium]